MDTLNSIKEKVDLLNDWHHQVDRRLDVIDERLRWVLRLAAASLALGASERLAPQILKMLGG